MRLSFAMLVSSILAAVAIAHWRHKIERFHRWSQITKDTLPEAEQEFALLRLRRERRFHDLLMCANILDIGMGASVMFADSAGWELSESLITSYLT
jgi:hypothetical protein